MERWRQLLGRTLDSFATLDAVGVARPAWVIGGGVALGLRYHHRDTEDLDVFLSSAQYLPALSPRLNDGVAHLAPRYEEAAGLLKLEFPEGTVDLLVAPALTAAPPERLVVDGLAMDVEAAVEVAAKKAFYRAFELKDRDVVDLALVLERVPEAAAVVGRVISGRRDVLLRRLGVLERDWPERVAKLAILADGHDVADRAPDIVRRWLEGLAPKS